MRDIGFITADKKTKKCISNIVDINFKHVCIIGETGCGKTTSMINPNINHRIKAGHGILVFDYKGNYHLSVKALADRNGRLDDVVMIGVPWGEKCNIIEDMDENAMIDFLKHSVGHEKDKFWEQSAIGVALPIMRILEVIEKLDKFQEFHEITKSFLQEYNYSINTLYNITISKEKLKSFHELLAETFFSSKRDSSIKKLLVKLIDKVDNHKDSRAEGILSVYFILEDLYKKFTKDIIMSSPMKSKNSTTFDNVLISLSGPLASIASNPYINQNDININEALNSGKIVIFVCNQLPEAILASVTKSIFTTVNERIGNKKHKDITIFIDEAQKVLNKDIDLPIDTLREARVEVFLAFQSKSLLSQKIGEQKAKALEVNLTSRYYFTSNMQDDDRDTALLEQFEFITNLDDGENIHKAKALFIETKELFAVERRYQKRVGAVKRFANHISLGRRHFVLHFIPSVYAKGKISLRFANGEIEHFVALKPFSKEKFEVLKRNVDDNKSIDYELELLEEYCFEE